MHLVHLSVFIKGFGHTGPPPCAPEVQQAGFFSGYALRRRAESWIQLEGRHH